MPSYAVILIHDYTDVFNAWDECRKPLYINDRHRKVNQHKPLKVRLGCEFAACLPYYKCMTLWAIF